MERGLGSASLQSTASLDLADLQIETKSTGNSNKSTIQNGGNRFQKMKMAILTRRNVELN